MIHVATEQDLKTLSRRGFLRMFTTTAPAAIIAPRKTFAFFGDILRRPAVQAMPALPQGLPPELLANPHLLIAGGIFAMFSLLSPGVLKGQ